jgi:hypothetical protein
MVKLFSINKVQIAPYIMLMIQNKLMNERIYLIPKHALTIGNAAVGS